MNQKEHPLEINFKHRQSAHCESGVTANLLNHYSVDISEALAFGIGSGLFFAYLPFIRLNHLPLTTFRVKTGGIMNKVMKRLGVRLKWSKFRNQQKAVNELDNLIRQNIPVGCRTGAYWLTYFPKRYRFHFNMHNLVVFGRRNGDYLISDPVFPEPVTCPETDFLKARFAKGPMAPKGCMYHIVHVPKDIDFQEAVKKGIREVCRVMLNTPGPIIGTRGIRFLAGQVEKWPGKLGDEKAVLYLGQLIRMQEEIGTGGGGFRFIYAAFLQEAAHILEDDVFMDFSKRMTQIGDKWRKVALMGSRICKKRASRDENYTALAEIIRECATGEENFFKDLREHIA